MQAQRNDLSEFSEHVAVFALKDKLRRLCLPLLRETPEYAQAKAERRAREWLDAESSSMAELLHMTMLARLEDLDG